MLGEGLTASLDGGERRRAVDMRFPDAKEVQIRPIQDHQSCSHMFLPWCGKSKVRRARCSGYPVRSGASARDRYRDHHALHEGGPEMSLAWPADIRYPPESPQR